uniref:Uncharacterized protein n=1 Tax=Cannabis sativa TaxID=3483 RepID=A0A803NNY1_CANSA
MLVNHYLRVLLDLNTPLVARLSLDNEDGIKSHLGDKDVETSQSKEKASTKRNKKGFDNMGWPIGVIPKSIFGHKSSGPPPFSGQKGKELNETEDVEQSHHVDSMRKVLLEMPIWCILLKGRTMGHSHFDKDGGVSRKLKPRLEGLEGGDGERSNWFDVRSPLAGHKFVPLLEGSIDIQVLSYDLSRISILFHNILNGPDWSGSFVYNLPMRYEMADFWENLALEITGIDSP